MAKKSFQNLHSLGIRHFDELIHDQSKSWLIQNFKEGATVHPLNVTRLMRNIVWQLRERIINKEREPLRELIRTFWYMFIKPTLSRAGALSRKADQYDQLVSVLVDLVKRKKIMFYKDIGFRDDNRSGRQVGINANVIIFAEKSGHQDFLDDMYSRYQVNTISLGGQPSVLNTEYFVDDIKASGVNLKRSFYLFSIVDFDTSGWIIRDAFIDNLNAFGIKNIKNIDLIHPDMLTPEEIKFSKFTLPDKKGMRSKNTKWIREVRKAGYTNMKYLTPKSSQSRRTIYGLEAEAISMKRIEAKLEELMVPLLGKSERLLRIFQLEQLNNSLRELILLKIA
ncbi:hypothetical protein IIB34_07640 [PVC group bacterium]|nr:hypothetical protein [PVC group bacterium]